MVCSHLSTPEKVGDYYMNSGPIMLVLGKCLCEDCFSTISSVGDLDGVVAAGRKFSDEGFQTNFVIPLIRSNRAAFRSKGYLWNSEATRWTWIGCSHVSKKQRLEEFYSSCEPLFFHEGFVACNDCLEVIPTAGTFLQAVYDCEPMKDEHFQARIIDRLYPLNIEMLALVRHYQSKVQRVREKL
jgi:hypothetical protein